MSEQDFGCPHLEGVSKCPFAKKIDAMSGEVTALKTDMKWVKRLFFTFGPVALALLLGILITLLRG